MNIASKSQQIMTEFIRRQQAKSGNNQVTDPFNINYAFTEFVEQIVSDPKKMAQSQISLWQDYMRLWESTTSTFTRKSTKPVIAPPEMTRDFKMQIGKKIRYLIS